MPLPLMWMTQDPHAPTAPRTDVSSKPLKYYKKNHLTLDNYTSLARMH